MISTTRRGEKFETGLYRGRSRPPAEERARQRERWAGRGAAQTNLLQDDEVAGLKTGGMHSAFASQGRPRLERAAHHALERLRANNGARSRGGSAEQVCICVRARVCV